MAFKMTKKNVLAIAHAFEHHPLNAKSIIKGLYSVTDLEFLQLQSNWNFNQFMDFREKKKRRTSDIKRADILRLATYGVEIAKKRKECVYSSKLHIGG